MVQPAARVPRRCGRRVARRAREDDQRPAAVEAGPRTTATARTDARVRDFRRTGRWNYAVVHVHGQPRFIEDRGWLYQHITQLTNEHESAQALPWKVDDAPAEFIERMLGAIVGFEIVISRIEGKWKTNQNRPSHDQLGVVAGLLGKGDSESKAMASLVRQHIETQ